MFFNFNQRNPLFGIFSILCELENLQSFTLKLLGNKVLNFSHTFTVIFAMFAPKQDGTRNRKKVYCKEKLHPQNTIVCQITFSLRSRPSVLFFTLSEPNRTSLRKLKWNTLIDIKNLPISQPHEPQHESPIQARPQGVSETGLSLDELRQYASHVIT